MDFALARAFTSVGVFVTLVSEWDGENSLGGEREERECNVREKSGLSD